MTVAITDVVLRDAHQSLFATRRLDDMLPVAAQLDDVGYRLAGVLGRRPLTPASAFSARTRGSACAS
jgi:oxaloacetate decarboxylase alpha subunit